RDLDPVPRADAVDHIMSLLRQATRVQGQDAQVGPNPRSDVDDHRRLGLEARNDGDLREALVRPAQDGLRLGIREELGRRESDHAVCLTRAPSASKPTRSTQLPKPSPASWPERNSRKIGRSNAGISAIGTFGA